MAAPVGVGQAVAAVPVVLASQLLIPPRIAFASKPSSRSRPAATAAVDPLKQTTAISRSSGSSAAETSSPMKFSP
nr:hypothetical protein [Halolamina pelagica]